MKGVGDLAPNTIIGPYRIVRRIGSGGMGVVYEAYEEAKKRKIALKIVLPNALVNDNAIERFRAEGRALAKIDHPNIVTLYELVVYEGLQVLAMEYLDGEPLDNYLLSHPCGMIDLIDIVRQIARGLKAAHAEKIIHRDLKPANILISAEVNFAGNMQRVVKVIDFGVSKIQADPHGPKTATDVILGTANYIAPEVLLGADAGATSDIYSLGLIFWQMLTGKTPFEGRTNVDVVRRIMNETIELPAKIDVLCSPSLKQFFKKMTARDHRNRYTNLVDVLSDLERIVLEPLPEGLISVTPVPVAVANQGEIRSRMKLQGFDPLEINFIMKLALEQEAGKIGGLPVVPNTPLSNLPEVQLREPIVARAIEMYKIARAQIAPFMKPDSQPSSGGALESNQPPSMSRLRSYFTRARVETFGSWAMVVVAVLVSGWLMGRVVMKRHLLQSRVPASQAVNAPGGTQGATGEAAKTLDEMPALEAPFPIVTVNDRVEVGIEGQDLNGQKYSKTEIWRVLSLTGDRAVWESDQRTSKLAFTNPFLGAIRLLNADGSSAKTADDSIIEGDVDGDLRDLFPLVVGKAQNFTRVEQAGTLLAQRYEANCRVAAREIVRLRLGTFDTFRVVCEAKDSSGQAYAKATYWYSPLAQGWLRSETEQRRLDGRQASRTTEVLSFRLANGNALRAPGTRAP